MSVGEALSQDKPVKTPQQIAAEKMLEEIRGMSYEKMAHTMASPIHMRRATADKFLKEAPLTIDLMKVLRAPGHHIDLEKKRRIEAIIAHHEASACELLSAAELQGMVEDKGPIPWMDMGLSGLLPNAELDLSYEAFRHTIDAGPNWQWMRNRTAWELNRQFRMHVLSVGAKGMDKETIKILVNQMTANEHEWTVRNETGQGCVVPPRQPEYWKAKKDAKTKN